MAKKKKATAWRALTGLNYVVNDKEKRVEAGDKITDLPENAVKTEKAARNIEPWVDRKTANVRNPEDADVEVTGVRSRHKGDEIVLKGVDE